MDIGRDLQDSAGPCDVFAELARKNTRAEKIRDYFALTKKLADSSSFKAGLDSIPPDFWQDEDFRGVLVETVIRCRRAEADLATIARVFGGKAEC